MRRFGFVISFLVISSAAWAAEPITLPMPKDVSEPRQPQVAVADGQHVYVTFGADKTVYCTASEDGGHQFHGPVTVASVPSLMLGSRRGPRIAVTKDAVVIAAIGQAGELLSWRSTDRGQTWRGPVKINDVPKSAREGLHALAAGPEGQLYCVWLDLRNNEPEVFGSGSTDGGKTWSPNRLIYRSPDGNVCECCHPSVTFDSEGNLYVMWRNWLDGNRDLYWSQSKDGGRTFSKAKQSGQGHWPLRNCPMDGGAIAAVKPGEIAAVPGTPANGLKMAFSGEAVRKRQPGLQRGFVDRMERICRGEPPRTEHDAPGHSRRELCPHLFRKPANSFPPML